MKKLILLWFSVILWTMAAWVAFTIPGDKLPETPGQWDGAIGNGAHFAIFFILAGLLYNAIVRTRRDAAFRTAFLIVFFVTASYGALTEIYQELVPGRYPSVKDGFLNAIGALNFLALAWANRAGFFDGGRSSADVKEA